VNGILLNNSVVQPTATPNDNSLPVSIGSRFHNAAILPFNGNIADVKIYNRALSQQEVRQNYQALLPRFAVTNGLVLDLDAGNRKSYPATGTTWTDLSGNGNNGTLTNGPTFNSSNGGSIVFDGSNDYVELGDVLDLGTNDMTINAWIYLNSSFSSMGYLVSKALQAAQDYRFGMYVTSTKKLATFVQGNTVGTDITPEADEVLLTDRFYMVTSVISRSSNISMYINGNSQSLTGSSTISQWNSLNFQSNNPFRVGAYTAANNSSIVIPFNGNIAKLQVYNRALTAAEITQNFNVTRGRFGI
jgi:hypothetical protein